MSIGSAVNQNQYISGGGEMGALIRLKDWEKTSLGEMGQWPQSLLTVLNILLSSKFPMFLWWGPELICFYNDSYRPSLGNNGKHPGILGQPAIKAWPEIWDIIWPLIEQVKLGGESVWQEDQLIPIFRNGKIEDVYWTFSYSPVKDESGKNAGVLVVCTETTDKFLGLAKIAESEKKFRNLVTEAIVATSILTGKDFVIELANDEALKLWGKDRSVIGKTIVEAIPELKGQPYLKILDDVFTTGITYEGKENIAWLNIDGILKPVYVNFIYKALLDSNKNIYGILVMGYEVTEQVHARNKIAEAEERTQLALDAALLGTFDINLATDKIIFSNRFCEIFGFSHINPSHQEFLNAVHPDDLHIRNEATQKAFETGFLNYEVSIVWPDNSIHWINAQGKIFYDENKKPATILGTVKDITEQKNSLQVIEESEKKFRNTVMQAPAGIAILKGESFEVEMANEMYLRLVDKPEKGFVGKPLFETLPEVKDVVEPLLNNVLKTGTPYYANELEVMLNRYGKKEFGYFNLTYQPLRESSRSTSSIMVVATEVTHQVETRNALLEREKQFRSVVTQSPFAIAIIKDEADWIIDIVNPTMLKNMWRKELHEVQGKKLMEVFPELHGQKFPQLLKDVFATGKVHTENEAVAYVDGNDGRKKYFVDFEYAPLFESGTKVSGVMITVYDVTEKVEARQQIKDAADRLLLATEGTQLATWDLNLQTRDIIHSPRLAEIFGHERSVNLTHQQMREIIHPADVHEIVEKAFDEALQTGIYNYEARVVHPDNSIHWIRTQGKVVFDEQNTPQRMLGTIIDITERKRSLQIIEESEKKFRTLADSMPQFIWTGDKEGHLNYFNQAVYNYSGLTPEQINKEGWIQIVHPDDREENIKQWLHSVATGEAFLFEHRFKRYDGEYRWQLSRAIPQKDANGNLQMWVGTSTDIDEIKKHDQQKDDFIKMASHELKTPVTTIKGYVQLLLKTHTDSNDNFLSGSLITIDKQVSKLTKLITDLLDVTKIETGSLQLTKEAINIGEKVKEIIKDINATTQTHTIILHQHAEPVIYADKNRIEQVVINLLTNAIKYSPKAKEVIVEIKSSEKMVTVSVKDFGIGISSGDHKKIFERFYRVSGKDEKTFPGFGIGLFIVHEIIQLHQGKIWVESEKNKGAVFYFSLPVFTKE
jgi:PAS domain S-box-containing protein